MGHHDARWRSSQFPSQVLSIITLCKSGPQGEERISPKTTVGTEWPKRHSDGCPDLKLLCEMYKRGAMSKKNNCRRSRSSCQILAALLDAANRSCLHCLFRCVPRAHIPSSIVFALCIDQRSKIKDQRSKIKDQRSKIKDQRSNSNSPIPVKPTLFDLNETQYLNIPQLLGVRAEKPRIAARAAEN
jgi:hypothetical protein